MTRMSKNRLSANDPLKPLSSAMCDFYKACLSFPTVGDITWQFSHPHQQRAKGRKK